MNAKAETQKATEKQPETAKMNLYKRISMITEEMGVIEKKITVGTGQNKYKAVGERDVLDNVKPLEQKYGVFSYPANREIIESGILTKESEYNGEKKEVKSQFIRIKTIYKFINMDNPEDYIEIIAYGDGIDTGDKACGKAMTYSDKYALMKCYKLSTGTDPDEEASPDNGYTAQKKATKKQIDIIDQYICDLEDTGRENAREEFITKEKIKSIEDLTMTRASEIITKILAKKGK